MLPKISCICVTYGRTRLLEGSIQCFLDQAFDGERELIVYNTFPQQKLAGIFPGVRIINCETRPPTLGDARNEAIELATGEIIVTWDDDDLFAPYHLQNIGFPMANAAVTWIWLDRQFYAEGNQILKIIDGQLPCAAFRKTAWENAGRYSALTVGEDRNFIGRVCKAGYGETIKLGDKEISFIYCWGNGAYHISGLGEDRKGLQPAHDRAKDDLDERVRRGEEPTGTVHLEPKLKVKPEYMIDRFLNKMDEIQTPRPRVCVIELGRYGDILNILPVCQHIAQAYEKPYLMVSREFASVLDGVSYVIPEIVDWPNDCLEQAKVLAKKKFQIVLRAQIWGKGHVQPHECKSYNAESWKEVGFREEFYDTTRFPLTLDRRDPAREIALYDRVNDQCQSDKVWLLVNLSGSVSSPFPDGPAILERIRATFSDRYEIIDLTTVQADRIYDVLGLMNHAAAMVCIDTAFLHLAAASNIPVVAIVNDIGAPDHWSASELRCNVHSIVSYSMARADHDAVIRAMHNLPLNEPKLEKSNTLFKPATRPRIWHAVAMRPPEKMDARVQAAQTSWDDLYSKNLVTPAHYSQYKRDARAIGHGRDLPYLKDVLEHAMTHAAPSDIIMWTNDDIWINPELPPVLEFYAGVYGAVFSQRCDFKLGVQMAVPRVWNARSQPHMGRDLFAFTKEWLTYHWEEIGDVILGASIWDLYLLAYIRRQRGIITDKPDFKREIFPCDLPRGYIAHQEHASQWHYESPSSPAERNNRNIFHDYARVHLPELKFTPELAV